MNKVVILIPIFNDWDSLGKLLEEIDKNIKDIREVSFDCIIVNDASNIEKINLKKPINVNSLKILHMKKNTGHARCNAFGIRYISQNIQFDNLILMDGDGEDRPSELKSLVSKLKTNPKRSIVAKRIKRSEGLLFQSLYQIHKLITFVFTGEIINFGNYSCLTKKDVKFISDKPSLWSSYSGTIKKFLTNLEEIKSERGLRYFGPSQMSLIKLILHSFSIIAVFKYRVIFISTFIIIILSFLNSFLGIFSLIFQLITLTFALTIFIVSLRESKKELIESHNNLEFIEEISH